LAASPVAIAFSKHFSISGDQAFVRTSVKVNTWMQRFREGSYLFIFSGVWTVKWGKQLCSGVVCHDTHIGLSIGNSEIFKEFGQENF